MQANASALRLVRRSVNDDHLPTRRLTLCRLTWLRFVRLARFRGTIIFACARLKLRRLGHPPPALINFYTMISQTWLFDNQQAQLLNLMDGLFSTIGFEYGGALASVFLFGDPNPLSREAALQCSIGAVIILSARRKLIGNDGMWHGRFLHLTLLISSMF